MGAFSYEIVDGKIAVVTFSHPPVNALGLKEKEEATELFWNLENDESIGAIILSSDPAVKGFSAGSDVKELSNYGSATMADYQDVDVAFLNCFRFSKVPLIAAVHGFAIAMGCAVAASCDIIISTPDALFGMPEIKVGMVGGEQYLARLMPDKKAHYLALTGNYITAEELYPFGQIHKLCEKDQLMEEALKVAREITTNHLTSVRFVKDCINRRLPNTLGTELQEIMDRYSRILTQDEERNKIISDFGKKDK